MNVLLACEFSGIVRSEFSKLGHYAISVDLLPTEIPGNHYLGKIEDFLKQPKIRFDLAICHPPCTYLTVAGARWFKGREREQGEALDFVRFLMNMDIPRICVENPVSVISTKIRKPDQIIQPWEYGHSESKKTCLWLKNLPLLKPTNILPYRKIWDNQTPSGQNKLGPSPDRGKIRSRTYLGIARAFAEQWGKL